MTPPNAVRAACPAPAALPKLSRAQANALRISARDRLWWDGMGWVWGDAGVNVHVIPAKTMEALERRGCLTLTRSNTLHPSDVGRAWLAANPMPSA